MTTPQQDSGQHRPGTGRAEGADAPERGLDVTTDGDFAITDWQEAAVTPDGSAPRLARASVINRFTGGISCEATRCEYALSYNPDGSGAFAGMQVLSGTLDGLSGSFGVEERGTVDARATVRGTFSVVPGSGTGDLVGLRGRGAYTVEGGRQPVAYTFTYRLG